VVYRARGETSVTTESFLVANRNVGLYLGVVTTAACWIQAPALLASGSFAFTSGYHFLVFWIPNVLALIIPAFLLPKMQERLPKGFTLPEFMGASFGGSVRSVAFVLQFLSLIGIVAFTLTGISQWLEPLVTVPASTIAIVLVSCSSLWVLTFGIKSALVTDTIKILFIGIGLALVFSLWWTQSPLPQNEVHAWNKVDPWSVIWLTGIPLAIALVGGPFTNPDLGERIFALAKSPTTLQKSYLGAAALFGIATLGFGSLGFLAYYVIPEKFTGFPAFALMKQFASYEVQLLISVGIAIILMAALGSYIASAGDLIAIEVYRRASSRTSDASIVLASRVSMMIPLIAGTFLATLPGVSVPKLLESLAVVRGGMIIPVLIAVLRPQSVAGAPIAIGMACALLGGVGITYSSFVITEPYMVQNARPLGALFALLCPLVFWVAYRRKK